MAFRIRARDVMIEVDSDRELRAVLSILGVLPYAVAPGCSDTIAEPTSKERFLRFYNRLSEGHQLEVIRALAQATVGLTDVELRSLLVFDSNTKLAGVMSGLSKNAALAGLSYADVVERQRTDGRDGSLYLYRLTAAIREIVPSEHSRQLWQQSGGEAEG